MPEIKHQFMGGRMNKDNDERLVPNGEYRDAMNIQVATSEASDVGTAQNVLGNDQVLVLIPNDSGGVDANSLVFTLPPDALVLGSISDEKVDTMYYLVWTSTADYILSWKRGDASPGFVFVDLNKNILKFPGDKVITGINIIDGLLFWTDNVNEPRKINVQRCKEGTISIANQLTQTLLRNNLSGSLTTIKEEHVTVIKKGPQVALDMELHTGRDKTKIYTAVIEVSPTPGSANPSSFETQASPGFNNPLGTHNFSPFDTESGSNTFAVRVTTGINSLGVEVPLTGTTPTGGPLQMLDGMANTQVGGLLGQFLGQKVVIQAYNDDGTPPGLPLTDYVIRGIIVGVDPQNSVTPNNGTNNYNTLIIEITSIDGTPKQADGVVNLKFVIDLFDETEKLFEFKYPRFSYRYKFEDGEYSTFAPFTQVAFIPGPFDYHPRKGYNLGMTNRLSEVELFNAVTTETPDDVIAVEILFKDDSSPSIYVVDTIKIDGFDTAGSVNMWNAMLASSATQSILETPFVISKEAINSIVPSNQLLRPWDNVPRKALAQDITGNRIVYANYTQNYDLLVNDGRAYTPNFSVGLNNGFGGGTTQSFQFFWEGTGIQTGTFKSIKSLREYQLGVVFLDEFGRETPVLSNSTGTVRIDKELADKANRFEVQFNSDDYPQALTHFKFFVKETSSEYYNMAMDRWYSAGDGNIWLAFPSSDRNKIDIDTFLVLKKGSDQDTLVVEAARYKVLAIESEAPDWIKTIKRKAVVIRHDPAFALTNLFGTSTTDAPLEGFTEFKMNYEPFWSTAGKDLADFSSDTELWVEFAFASNDELSSRYRIVSIAHDFDPSNPTAISLANSQFTIQLATALGNDVNFITDDPSGAAPSKIETNAIVNIYKYKVENLDRFDGRFFVKIYFDEVFRNNIQKTVIGGGKRVAASRKVYSMNSDMVRKHTEKATQDGTGDRFLTKGLGYNKLAAISISAPEAWRPIKQNSFSNYQLPFNVANKTSFSYYDEYPYGYYIIDEFAAHALYFRKYMVKDYDYTDGIGQPQNATFNSYTVFGSFGIAAGVTINASDMDKELNDNGYQVLMHLQDGGTGPNLINYPNSHNSNKTFSPAINWHEEFGYHTGKADTFYKALRKTSFLDYKPGFGSPNATFRSYHQDDLRGTGLTTNWYCGPYELLNSSFVQPQYQALSWYETNSAAGMADKQYESDIASAQNNEVWFIDFGQSAGVITSTINYELDALTNTPNYQYNTGLSLAMTGGGWGMQLSFGGLIGGKSGPQTPTSAGFWNIGNWNSSTQNTHYDDNFNTAFVGRLKGGERFRWREDPTQTEYVLSAVISGERMRHSQGKVVQPTFPFETPGPNYTDSQSTRVSIHTFPGVGGGGNRFSPNDLESMSEKLSFNMTKHWDLQNVVPALVWDPTTSGEIANGLNFSLDCISNPAGGGTISFAPTIQQDLKIFVPSITTVDASGSSVTLHEGMALKSIETVSGASELIGNYGGNSFLVVRKINFITASPNSYYELILGGYTSAIQVSEHNLIIASANSPKVGTDTYNFVQVGMNGYSQNSEFNFNTIGRDYGTGAVGAVGYTLEFIDDIQPTEILSENPAIWETEPKDLTPLDIYYEACGSIPMSINADNVSDAFPIGTKLLQISAGGFLTPGFFIVVGYNGDEVVVETHSSSTFTTPPNALNTPIPEFFRPDDLTIKTNINSVTALNGPPVTRWSLSVEGELTDNKFALPWHNCYSFGNGVESNRIRDNYNAPYISNGVKASTTLEQEYKEEHRKYGLIYSGIYNSISGINNLNQFIQAEKITKDINPKYGSIQKLYSRDSDLVTLCEDKILRISANKDALFNADGKPQLIATDKVLGQTIPFAGEYGISKNPESFASESYRAYFTDRVRGAVLRLSKDGLTPISDSGMKDWFRDNLRDYRKLIGSFDDRNDEYNITLSNYDKVSIKGFTAGRGPLPFTHVFPGVVSSHQPLDDGLWIQASVWDNMPLASTNAITVGSTIQFSDPNTGDQLVPIGTTITSIQTGLTLLSSVVDSINAQGLPVLISTPTNYVKIEISSLIVNQTTGLAPIYPRLINPDPVTNSGNTSIGSGLMNFGELLDFRITLSGFGPNQLLSFSEKVKGWVSFKSFANMQMGISLANDYYTFDRGNLYLHYSESQDRNTFYSVFTPSSLDVVLNDKPGLVKVFNTLNYEGSQSKVDRFTSSALSPQFQPTTTYNDQEYYNLSDKPGWFVESIVTNKEEGYVNEFLDKEGKWFNHVNKTVDTSIKADTCDFTFQGIGFTSAGGGGGGGCIDTPGNPIVTGTGDCSALTAAHGVVLDLRTAGLVGGYQGWIQPLWEYMFANPTLTTYNMMFPALISPTQSAIMFSNDPGICMVDPSEPGYVTGEINQWVRIRGSQLWRIFNGNNIIGYLNPVYNGSGTLPIGSVSSTNATFATNTASAIGVIDKMIALYNANHGGNYVQECLMLTSQHTTNRFRMR